MASLCSQVYYLEIRPEPTQVIHLSGAPVKGRVLAFTTNIRLGWKGFQGHRLQLIMKIRKLRTTKVFIVLASGLYVSLEEK